MCRENFIVFLVCCESRNYIFLLIVLSRVVHWKNLFMNKNHRLHYKIRRKYAHFLIQLSEFPFPLSPSISSLFYHPSAVIKLDYTRENSQNILLQWTQVNVKQRVRYQRTARSWFWDFHVSQPRLFAAFCHSTNKKFLCIFFACGCC